MLLGLTHVAVAVTNMEKSVEFYTRIPGVEEKFRITGDDGIVWTLYLQVGPRQFIELFPGAKGPYQATGNAGPVHPCLEVDDIQAMYREVVQAGIETRGEPIMGGDMAYQFWIDDPDGNPIEFHQFTPDSMQLQGE